MSKAILKKDSSYSEFRKKHSLSKSNLHNSMIDMENSLSLIADEKTQQISSLQQELQSIVRNRSLSNKPNAKSIVKQSLKITIAKTLQPEIVAPSKTRRNSLKQLNQSQSSQNLRSARQMNHHTWNQPFQIIQESQIFNEEDNVTNDMHSQHQKNKITIKNIRNKNEKSNMLKKKDSNQKKSGMNTQRQQTKFQISQLDEMQKRLESAKKNRKIQIKDRKVKKADIISSKPVLKNDKRLYKTASQTNFFIETKHRTLIESVKQKQKDQTPKLTTRKRIPITPSTQYSKSNSQTLKQNVQCETPSSSPLMIPTQMVTGQQKEKLLKEFSRLSDIIKTTQICVDNMEMIRNMLKNMEKLVIN